MLFFSLKDVYLRADFGILEEMFSGFGGEIFYRPIDKQYSFGLTLHRVRQRGYEQRFLRDYETTTGHFGFIMTFHTELLLRFLQENI